MPAVPDTVLYLSSQQLLWVHMLLCISLTEAAFKIAPQQNNEGRLRGRTEPTFTSRPVNENCFKTQTQNKWTAAILFATQWKFQHSLHGTVLKGLLSDELPHQHSWSLWHFTMHRRVKGTAALLCADACIRTHECILKSQYQPFLAGTWRRRRDPLNRHRSVELSRVCPEPVERCEGKTEGNVIYSDLLSK